MKVQLRDSIDGLSPCDLLVRTPTVTMRFPVRCQLVATPAAERVAQRVLFAPP